MYNILVCDDDKEIVEAIDIYLSQEGYHILKAYDGVEALNILEKEKVNLLILDVMMPKLDGIRATLKIRETNSVPIIILSAKSEDSDKILGLNIGADDYVTKPFNPLELVARVKSQLRRYNELGGTSQEQKEKVYEVGGLRINDDLKEVTVDGELVKLTPVNIILPLFTKIRDRFHNQRFMSRFGMKRRLVRIIQLRSISAIFVKKSRSIRKIQDI